MKTEESYKKATVKTATSLRSVAHSQSIRELTSLSLPEIDAVVDLTAQIVPAGNVPGMILTGLARISDQHLPFRTMQQHINLLFKGVEQVLDRVAYGAIFAGPAAVIWGYQNLLKLAGKDPDSSFPEGIWQFYVDYALREDTARHANETHGFDTLLAQHEIKLNDADRLTAWIMAAISCLHQYDALLENEWRERVSLSLLRELTCDLPDAARYAGLYREWEIQRPYRRGAEAARYDYPGYRRVKLEHFLDEGTRDLPPEVRHAWATQLNEREERELEAYRRQMSILAWLEPGPYGEMRTPFPLEKARVGVIHQDNYYLFPACLPGGRQAPGAEMIRAQVAALLASPAEAPARLAGLARVRRTALVALRRRLDPAAVQALETLRYAPILINHDLRPADLPLTAIRQAERGVGDHALTIFRTGRTVVFDQSHIFFDGALGAALAEIMTNEALSWAAYLGTLPTGTTATRAAYTHLHIPFTPGDLEAIEQAPCTTPEAGAETERINIKACLNLRRMFKQRNAQLQLTVNDLLVLYRAIHALQYQPSRELAAALRELAADPAHKPIVSEIRKAVEALRSQSPAMLIPIDASRRTPRDRIFPLSMEVPLAELDLIGQHHGVILALEAYEAATGDRSALYAEFDRRQRTYLASLAGFGLILDKMKAIAGQGQSASVGAIKLLAGLPPAIQQLLDRVPERFEMLNNLLKGREVFSNVGAVAPSSTLIRFSTAKDDNEQKQLAWGFLTDASGVMRVSLRDFRPHVASLRAIGRSDLADQITRDYLDSYANGFNIYIRDLQRITAASRKTQYPKQRARHE
jgi:hypothetical protein